MIINEIFKAFSPVIITVLGVLGGIMVITFVVWLIDKIIKLAQIKKTITEIHDYRKNKKEAKKK